VIGDINDEGAGQVAGEIGATAAHLDVTAPESAVDVVASMVPSRS
jgi:hypothetical protein